MTNEEIRDELARLNGWTLESLSTDCPVSAWWRWNAHPTLKSRTWCKDHPFPPTLDGANAAVPEGYEWERHAYEWIAWKPGSRMDDPIKVPDTGDKIADLYALALACRKAMEASNGK